VKRRLHVSAVLVALAFLSSCGEAGGPSTAAEDTNTPGGEGAAAIDSTAIRRFQIEVPDAVLADLKDRLSRTRFPDELNDVGWAYGTDLQYLKALVAYWRDQFDWREQERRLNDFDHFKTTIDGLDVHFIHQRSPVDGARPLLITHGWPGSFVEFTKIIGPLTDPVAHGGQAADAFQLVIPSIPGYGFSDKPREPGYSPARMADILAALMDRLGYERYGAQGGDWGSIITRALAAKYPDRLIGIHLNMMTGGAPPGVDTPDAGVPVEELERMRARQAFMENERGYGQIQGSKPQTLGYGLNDSPAGLAAWIVEKFRTWCDCEGDPERKFTKDELLTNITLYWVTETITSSTRLYYESRTAGGTGLGFIKVPTGAAIFPKELFFTPRTWAQARYNLVHWTEMPRGGHFAAMEEPELLVNDIRAFFRTLK